PVEAHALHRVQGGLALDLLVVDVGPPCLELAHRNSLEQMFGLLTGTVAAGFLNGPMAAGWPAGEGPKASYFWVRRVFGRGQGDGQKSFSTHSSQRGRRATQTRRPCRIRRSDSAVHSLDGTIRVTCASIFSGTRVFTSPRRLLSRVTCVSTAKPGMPKPAPRITFAVLRPIPGTFTRSSMRGGTSPPNCSTSVRLAAMMRRVLVLKNPVALMIFSTSAGSAPARSKAAG